jgi:hypothetical protein
VYRIETLGLLFAQVQHPSSDYLQTSVLEAAVDLAYQVLLYPVRLDN